MANADERGMYRVSHPPRNSKKVAPSERNIPRNIIHIEFSSSGAAHLVYKLIFGIEYNA